MKSVIRTSRAVVKTVEDGLPDRTAETTVLVLATTRTMTAGGNDLGVDLRLGQWRRETGELTHGVEQPIELALSRSFAEKVHKILHLRTVPGRKGFDLLDQGLDRRRLHRVAPVAACLSFCPQRANIHSGAPALNVVRCLPECVGVQEDLTAPPSTCLETSGARQCSSTDGRLTTQHPGRCHMAKSHSSRRARLRAAKARKSPKIAKTARRPDADKEWRLRNFPPLPALAAKEAVKVAEVVGGIYHELDVIHSVVSTVVVGLEGQAVDHDLAMARTLNRCVLFSLCDQMDQVARLMRAAGVPVPDDEEDQEGGELGP